MRVLRVRGEAAWMVRTSEMREAEEVEWEMAEGDFRRLLVRPRREKELCYT